MTPETWYEHARKAIKRSLGQPEDPRPTVAEYMAADDEIYCERACGDSDCLANGCSHHRPQK